MGLKTPVPSALCVYHVIVLSSRLYFISSYPLQIGSVLTPWPSWLIAAHPSTDRVPIGDLNKFLKTLSTYVSLFKLAKNRTSTLEFIKDKFGYQAEDIKVRSSLRMYIYSVKILILFFCGVQAWLDSVAYPNNCAEIPIEVIRSTLRYVPFLSLQ